MQVETNLDYSIPVENRFGGTIHLVLMTVQLLDASINQNPKSKKPPLSLTRALLTWWPGAESNRAEDA